MNKVYLTVLGALIVGLFANCGKKDDSHDGGAEISGACYLMQSSAIASTNPAPGGQCSYNYAAAPGFSSASNVNSGYNQMAGQYGYGTTYGAGYGNGYGTSGYGSSMTPTCANSMTGTQQILVYSGSKGVGCVDSTRLFMSGQVATYDINRTTMNFSLIPTPTSLYSNNPYTNNQYGTNPYGTSPYGASPYATSSTVVSPTMVLRVCDASELCASGQTCRSPIGPTAQIASPIGVCYYN
jgi:hypothetical protein